MSDKGLPPRRDGYSTSVSSAKLIVLLVSSLALSAAITLYSFASPSIRTNSPPLNAQEILDRCRSLHTRTGPHLDFSSRVFSERFDHHENDTLIVNATIFTGAKNGTEVLKGDILISKGVIKALGEDIHLDGRKHSKIVDVKGAWVTPGLVNIYSHQGVLSSPVTRGANELDSHKGPIVPWLRSIDGFHTYDDRTRMSVARGITAAQAYAGRTNHIGAEAFVVKLRKTLEGSPSSMIVEPHTDITGDKSDSSHWRHLIQSCGESTRRNGNRMDGVWALRSAYAEARKIVRLQDTFCAKAEAGLWDATTFDFPESLRWEVLAGVLRGKVKVSNVCSEAVDLANMIRISEEFDFPVAAFLLAAEAWLVPGLLKRMDGHLAIGLSATNYGHNRETYMGSPFAPRVLHDQNISVVMISDETYMSSNYILDEARKAYQFGLPESAALASVTSTPAKVLGLSHRIGVLRKGSDADLVVWDSHPLHMGATPVHVWIDGAIQFQDNNANLNSTIKRRLKEGHVWTHAPRQPNYDRERKAAIRNEGMPAPRVLIKDKVVFKNVKEVWRRERGGDIKELFPAGHGNLCVVVIEKGKITCLGEGKECSSAAEDAEKTIDLEGGSISPGLLTFGSRLGLEEMASELSTGDGIPYNAFAADVPRILQDVGGLVRASDALMFGTLHARMAYQMGVTFAASSLMYPLHTGEGDTQVIWGLSTAFRTGAEHAFDKGAFVQEVVALHIRIVRPSPLGGAGRIISVSEQLAGIRRLLYGWEGTKSDTGEWFRAAAEGRIPLVIEVHNADIMTSLLIMKAEIDERIGGQMRMVFVGASEAHVLAKEIGNAGIGVILTSLTPDVVPWDARRTIPGQPLTNYTALTVLLEHDVNVGFGVEHPQFARDTKFHLGQIAGMESNLDRQKAYGLASTNLERLLGVKGLDEKTADLVAFHQGSVFDSGSKPVAVISPLRASVDVF